MEKPTNKEMLMDATMRIVAEKGLSCFSMRQVTSAIGVSEALIYRHYTTKENLLFQCFQSVDRQLADLFASEKFPSISSEKELYLYLHDSWIKYFSFLIQNDYKTLYYFEYRDSPHFLPTLKQNDSFLHTYIKSLADCFRAIGINYRIPSNASEGYFHTYIFDVTGIFAKRVIRGELPADAKSKKQIWRLIYLGLSGFSQKASLVTHTHHEVLVQKKQLRQI
ncbi:TetR/AcrR family transcriptional regulator [Solibaculum mannosilyticum]|uniref:TetR/AcrR family transcriptional regulator n=1 Tax=Solibaculum mannosilyticum TaxID=2780922 RepID=UPI0007A8D7A1|nr:transcriptional regulator BetI [Eubacteriaceae bacterium CHKCI005]